MTAATTSSDSEGEMDFETTIETGFGYQIDGLLYQGAEAKVTKCIWLGRQAIIKERFENSTKIG